MRIGTKLRGLFFVIPLLLIWVGSSYATVGKPMVVYSENETASIQSSQFNSSTSTWATAATAATTSRKQYWKVAKTHPKGNKKAVVSVENPASGDPYIYASLWDESNWDDGTGASYNDVKQLGQVYTNNYRCFDAAYEETSGKLLVVAASPTANTIKYWTWNGTAWSSENTYAFSTTLGNIHWIRLASNPKQGSNEISLVCLDNSSKVSVLVWNGTSWGNEANVATNANTNTQEVIDIDYTKAGRGTYDGYAIAVWGWSTRIYYTFWNGSSWTYGAGYYKPVTGSPYWIRYKSDPNNYYSAAVYENSDNDIYAVGWQGTSPLSGNPLITSTAIGDYRYHRPFDLVYSSGSDINTTFLNGYIYVVYGDASDLKHMPCQSSTGAFSCGGSSNVRNGTTSYYAYWVQAERSVDNTLHMAIHDMNDDLVMWTFVPNTWTYRGTISTNLENETNHVHEVFALTTERAAKAMAALSLEDYSDTYYSPYSSHAWATSTAIGTAPSSYERFWNTVKNNADGTKQFVITLEYTNSTSVRPTLFGSIYSGATWGTWKNFGNVYSDTEDRTGSYYYNSRTRVFDAAFETSDGHILVVATDPDYPYEMKYWTYNGTTWSSFSTLSFTNLNSSYTIKWARLASNPKADSNEIALIVAANSGTNYGRAVAKIWNGSSWGNEVLLSSDLNPTYTSSNEAIAVEYMQAGSEVGKAVFAWADQYSSVFGRVWNGSSWGTAQSKAAANEVRWIRLKADPSSSNMMLGFERWARYVYALKWTGTGWESSSPTQIGSQVYGDSNDPINRPFDLCFESGYGHSGHVIFVYGDSGGNYTYYNHYDGSSWGSQGTVYYSYSAFWIELDRANDNTIHMALHEGGSQDPGYTLLWNNSSWIPSHRLHSTATALQRGELGGSASRYPQVFSLTKVSTATPEIHALDYNFGTVGTTITIHGAGFGVTQGSSTVKFYNNQTATVTSWSDVKIVVTVPSSTASGYIAVTRGSNSDTISFTAVTGAPTITAVLPDRGSSFSDIDMAYITGTNLSPGATVKLTRAGQSDITATNVTASSSTRIETATFNITSAAMGYWNVVVTNPDTQTVTSSNAFAVVPPSTVTTSGAQARASGTGVAYPNERHLVRDSGGNWYALFIGDDSCVYMTKSTDGSTWDTPACVFAYSGGAINTSTYAQEMSVDIYRSGNVNTDAIHLIWKTDNGNYKDVLYSKCSTLSSYTSATSWAQVDGGTSPRYDTITNVNGASYSLYTPDVAVDSQGYPHITWYYQYSSNKYILYRTSRTGTGTPKDWDNLTRTVATYSDESGFGDVYYPSSIDIDSTDRVYISWPMYQNTSGKYAIRIGWTTDWTTWDTANRSTVISNSTNNFYESSLIVDSGNKVYVVAKEEVGRDLYWAYYNGSTWSTNNNLTNGSYDIESAVVGAKMGSGITDHILLSKVYDASSNKKVIYWRWNNTNSNWNKYDEELDTGNESRSYVTIERHAPASSALMGYLFYDTSGDSLKFDRFTSLGFVPGTSGFPYQRPITIPDSMTPASCSSSLTSFPVLVKITDATLKTAPFGGHVQNANGYDIIFRGANGTLDHEIEKYVPTTGELVAWVRIPTLVHNAATVIYMCYGNSTITSPTANPTGVWSNDYAGVWHLADTSGITQDSTSYNTNGTVSGTITRGATGKIDGAFDCYTNGEVDWGDPVDGHFDFGTGSFTFGAWVNIDQIVSGGAWPQVIWKGSSSGAGYALEYDDANNKFYIWINDGSNTAGSPEATFSDDTWYYIVGVVDRTTNRLRIYKNGAEQGTGNNISGVGSLSNAEHLTIGADGGWGWFDGLIDEVRISTGARDACWIGTEFNSIDSPASVGNEEANNPTVVKLKSFTATGNGKHIKVDWETASEIDNLGFNLYRSTKKEGSYTKLNASLIPGLLGSPTGRKYTYDDKKVTKGKLYYYKLEDIDLSGKKTMHGPICVDWNGDGIPDDEQSKKKSSGLSSGSSIRRPVTQNSRVNSPYAEGSRVIAPETRSFTARQGENRVLLEWRTAYEVNILGYHLYREENGELLRLTPELVAGSALFAGNALPAGNAYTYWDDLALGPLTIEDRPSERGLRTSPSGFEDRPIGLEVIALSEALLESHHKWDAPRVNGVRAPLAERAVTYWLLEVTLSGDRSWCGPVAPIPDETLKIPEYLTSPLLSGLGTNQFGQPHVASRTKESSIQRLGAPGPIDLQWALAAGSAIKLSVNERGWYRVTRPQLVAAGLDRRVDPRLLQLFVDGIEQAIYVKGEKDGRFGRYDFIEFYGEGLDTPSTDTRIYWLAVGQSPGKRISTLSTQLGQASSESSFPFTLELKERTVYFSALRNGEENNFFGPVIGTTPVERPLNVPYPDPSYSVNATLTVSIQGVTVKPHQVQVLVNGESVGEVVFDGQAYRQVALEFPQSVLLEGENTITLAAQGQDLDVTLLDTVQLTYWRTFTSDGNDLEFTLSSPGQVSIDGFRRRSIRVADVTDPEEVRLVSGTRVSRGSHGYAVRFNPNPGSENRTWLAFSKADIKTPVEVKANQVSTWHQETQGADLVIISNADFMESLQPLKTHRESQGYSVALIDLEDIFDEFSYGTRTPQAIKNFLTRASTSWQTPPRFVLLVGDASFDPRNYLGLGNQDFLPTKLLDTTYMETASDDWFVDFDNDGLPDMAIGRLPVQTAEEAATVVTKLIAYDQAPSGDWTTEALMVADQNGEFDFEGASQEVSDLLPEQMTVWSVYRGQAGDAAARTAILGSINEGKLIINYMGHGAVDLWKSSVLTASDADSLTNGSALPLVVSMTCLNGYFHTPYVESLAEALLKAQNGGAVAIWTSSGLTDPAGQLQMNKGMAQFLFNGEGLTLGEAASQAKAATNDQDVRRSWVLFGDPTTRLKP